MRRTLDDSFASGIMRPGDGGPEEIDQLYVYVSFRDL
jgi:hypothetical protein